MKAIVQDEYSTADDLVFVDIDRPVARGGEVRNMARRYSVYFGRSARARPALSLVSTPLIP